MGFRPTARIVACCAASALVFGLVGLAAPASADSGWSNHGANNSSGNRQGDGGYRQGDSGYGHDHGGHGHNGQGGFFVSPQGSSSGWGDSCDNANFTSIGAAVAAAPAGATVVVCPGTYQEDVLVNKALSLLGRDATIDATGLENAIQVVASDVRIDGFTVENANGEGVLVGVDALTDAGLLPASGPVLSDVTVQDVSAINNDQGFSSTGPANCKYPGDCGGGIHLNGTTRSVVQDNTVTGNADGVLLTDDYAPNSYNLVADNVVDDNLHECGIVLPSHSKDAVTFDPTTYQVTAVNPTLGGVYGNVVRDNIADGNGTDIAPPQFGGGGSGSGIGLFGSGPGAAVYDNFVFDNEASGNGLAGIAMHAHLPGGEDINGNVIVHNDLGTNNVGGDGFDGPPGPTDFQTTGIAIYSAVLAHLTVADNHIHDDIDGIWLSTTVTADGLNHNHFDNVTTPITGG
jgi:parallel beta-helix repeat protein